MITAESIQALKAENARLRRRVTELRPRFATVTQASPLRIRLDGETSALDITPEATVTGLVVDDRVVAQTVDGRPTVTGKLQ